MVLGLGFRLLGFRASGVDGCGIGVRTNLAA